MKKAAVCLFVFLFPVLLSGGGTEFQSPDFDSPYYRMIFSLNVRQDEWVIKELRVDGRRWESFFVLLDGKHVEPSKPLAKGSYTIEVDYAWRSSREYAIDIFYAGKDFPESRKFSIRLKSPAEGGVPFESEGFYRVFRAKELIGMQRKGEICTLTFTAAKKDFENREFILADGSKRIPCQILDLEETTPPARAASTHPVTVTCRIAFPLDMSPHQKKMLFLLAGSPLEIQKTGFAITGKGVGKTIKNECLSLEFHPQSGQVNVIENLTEGVRLFNEAGVIHWNPGVHIPGIAWDHSFNWNPPPSFDEIAGEYLYVNTRKGPLRSIEDVKLEVRYALEAHSPYFVSETLMTVNADLGVSAIRNDEMVLYKGLFDSLIYKDKKGRIIEMTLRENPSFPDGLVHVAPDDVEWVGLLNTEKKFGFFSLRLAYANPGLSPSGSWLNKPGTYFYAPSDGKYVYWVRPLLYTWSEYPTRNLLTHVPKGSIFYEKNAYVILRIDGSLAENLDSLLIRLKNPVWVY
jgi:hypothetical protein